MCRESAAETLQTCAWDYELRGAGGGDTQGTPHRSMKWPALTQGELCHTPCASSTLWSRRVGYPRLNTTWRHRTSFGLVQWKSYSALQELTLVCLGFFFPLPGISPKSMSWQYEDFSFHFSFYGVPEENCWSLSLLRDKELQWFQGWCWR